MLDGEVVLQTNAGEDLLTSGDCAGFKAGDPDGHCLINRSDRPVTVLEVGGRHPDKDAVDYPDIDLVIPEGTRKYFRRDGTAY